jgi:hypothetical protein
MPRVSQSLDTRAEWANTQDQHARQETAHRGHEIDDCRTLTLRASQLFDMQFCNSQATFVSRFTGRTRASLDNEEKS